MTTARRWRLDEETGPSTWEMPGLDVDIRAAVRELRRHFAHGRPEPFGPCGISVRLYSTARVCCGSVIVTQAPWDDGTEWIHASIAHEHRMPTYDELAALKAGVYGPQRFAFQVFAAEDRHISIHDRALHLWGRADGASPLPDFGALGTI